MDWNYYNTFIKVAPDSEAVCGLVPPDKKNGRTKASIEYELASAHPYGYTQEELLYELHVRHKGITQEELDAKGTQLRDEFYQKPTACLRASTLAKKYGWGIHFNEEGKLALVAVDSPEYEQYAQDESLQVVNAMRSSRKK
ncbi:DUF6157 family protein [Paenibacillus sp. GCM10023252]|uniref:DUF6157 family protein n=1 Tax=Paenibacillus sp. GCM10023252 TaxID=3252649 RepID=UPI0036060BB0